MVNQDLVNYLAEGRKRGFSIQLLKGKLLEGGFPEQDVNEAINFLERQSMQQRPAPQPVQSQKVNLFDTSQNQNYMRAQPTQQPFTGIQQKQEVKLEEKKEMKKSSSGEGKWIKIAGVLGVFLLLIHITGIVLNFVAPDFLSSLVDSSLTLLILAIILVLMGSLYYYAFARIGNKTGESLLSLGAWFTIVPTILYIILAVVAGVFVYQQSINFFSGVDAGGSYKITFLIVAILWVVALLLHLIGQILLSMGMLRAGKHVKFFSIAGILNIFVFLGGVGFLIGIVMLIYSILNAFSTGSGAGYEGITQVINQKGIIAIWSFMVLFGVKVIARIFEVMGLFDASKKLE